MAHWILVRMGESWCTWVFKGKYRLLLQHVRGFVFVKEVSSELYGWKQIYMDELLFRIEWMSHLVVLNPAY